MNIERRSDPNVWMDSGRCPFWFHDRPPHCWVIRVAAKTPNLFQADEVMELAEIDCDGDFPDSCPLVDILWDPSPNVSGEAVVREVGGLTFEFIDASIDDDYDSIIVPTTTSLIFDGVGRMPDWNSDVRDAIARELSMFEPPLSIGDAVVTNGVMADYDHIAHVAIFDDVNGDAIASDIIRQSVAGGVRGVAGQGCRSVIICPMSLVAPDESSIPPVRDSVEATLLGVADAVNQGVGVIRFGIRVPDGKIDVAVTVLDELVPED